MLLQSTILREGGSRHEIDGVTYHFAPRAFDGAHVCEVSTSKHVKAFLAIDGFEIADELDPPIQPVPLVLDVPGFLGTGMQETPLHVSDSPATDAPAWVPPPEGTVPEWVPPTAAPIAPAASILDGTDAVAEPLAAPDYESMSDDDLDAAFIARFDRKPHPKAKRPSIIAKLIEADQPDTAGN